MHLIKSGFELELLRLIRHVKNFIFAVQIELIRLIIKKHNFSSWFEFEVLRMIIYMHHRILCHSISFFSVNLVCLISKYFGTTSLKHYKKYNLFFSIAHFLKSSLSDTQVSDSSLAPNLGSGFRQHFTQHYDVKIIWFHTDAHWTSYLVHATCT